MLTLLIDADIILYQIASAVEEPFDWGNDLWTLHSDASEAKQRLDYWVEGIKKKLDPQARLVFALTSSDNWRNEIMPSYKSHRKGVRKPLVFSAMKDYIRSIYRVYELPRLEADDILGLLSTGGIPCGKKGGEKVIVSTDKDFKTIPGKLYNPNDEDIQTITEEEANYSHLFQTLVGDSADGYSGCPSVGEKTAEKILTEHGSNWFTVVNSYKKVGLNEDEALRQARVARILRKGDYNVKTGDIKLWNPNNESGETVVLASRSVRRRLQTNGAKKR